MQIPKILVAAPIAKAKDYIIHQWIEHIQKLTYQNYSILLVDNSRDQDYHKKLQHIYNGIKIIYCQPDENESIQSVMARSMNIIRDRVLADVNIIGLMSIECDVFTPVNCIEYLLFLKKRVVGLPYFTAHSFYSKAMLMKLDRMSVASKTQWLSLDSALIFCDGKLKPMFQTGLGCLFIHRNVLKDIPFRSEIGESGHPDTFFHKDLKLRGESAYIQTDTWCSHINGNWRKIYQ